MSVTTSIRKDASLEGREYVAAQARTRSTTVKERATRRRTPMLNVMGQVLTVVPPLVLAVLLFVSWYITTVTGRVSSLFLPKPGDVLASLSDGIASGMYLSNTLVTVQESMLGFLIALAIALPLGYGIAKSRLLAITIQPYLSAGQAIPAIVIAPLLILWLGYGILPNVVICTLVVLFPMVINTILGMRTIDRALIDAARVEGAASWSLLAHVEFPLALPAILAAIRSGFTLSIVGALVGEVVSGGDSGLGSLVVLAKNQYNTPFMFATLVVLAALAALYYGVTWFLVKLAEVVY
jgi:putative riboflavin transport system permease protein